MRQSTLADSRLRSFGMPKAQAARLVTTSLFSFKRYTRTAHRRETLTLRKEGGRPPKADENTERLLEKDVKTVRRTVVQMRLFVQRIISMALSESTVWRLLKRMDFSRKKDYGGDRTGRILEVCSESDGRRRDRVPSVDVRRRDGHEHVALSFERLG